MNRKFLFFLVWTLIILIGPVTVLRNTPLSVALSNQTVLINFLQRIVGTVAFSMLFVQIILGAFMQKWTEKLGAWIFSFHKAEGATAYSLIVLHPLLFVLFNFKIKGVFDPFYVYTDLCVLCSNSREFFYTFGRLAFWLITVAVAAALLRNQPWLRVHWRKFHILNYVAFLSVAFHSWNVGTDTHSEPFLAFFWFALSLVLLTIVYKLFKLLKK